MFKRIHHFGIVVENIPQEYRLYKTFGFSVLPGFESPKTDLEQRVVVGALEKEGMVLELLEPLDEKSPIYNFQKNGGGPHHICYETVNVIGETIEKIKKFDLGRQITAITKSVWNAGRPVVFFAHHKTIFEIIGPKE